jgi:hypothetical protein
MLKQSLEERLIPRKSGKSLIRGAAVNRRDPNHIKFFPQVTPVLSQTVEGAQEKYNRLIKKTSAMKLD